MKVLGTQASALSATLIRELDSIKQSFDDSVRGTSTGHAAVELFDKRYIFIVLTSRTLPKLMELFADSHRKTTDLLEAGAIDRARAQYIFEEHERERALEATFEQLTKILDGLAVSVENHIALTTKNVVTGADNATTMRWSSRSWWH